MSASAPAPMPSPRRLFVFLVALLLAPLAALAHDPLQNTASLGPDEENLAVSVTLSQVCSLRLLAEAGRPAELDEAAFAERREAFAAAAPAVCVLLSASGEPIAPQRVLVSLNRDRELHYLFLYAADVVPARLRMDHLATQPPGAFCEFSDDRASPPHRAVLRADARLIDFAAPAAPRS